VADKTKTQQPYSDACVARTRRIQAELEVRRAAVGWARLTPGERATYTGGKIFLAKILAANEAWRRGQVR